MYRKALTATYYAKRNIFNNGSPTFGDSHVSNDRHSCPTNKSETAMPAKSHRVNNPKQLAAAFASTVTVHSFQESDWIARNGRESIFALFKEVFPEVRIIQSIGM
jgi:hypothetical protein